jgi:hypothetical protein
MLVSGNSLKPTCTDQLKQQIIEPSTGVSTYDLENSQSSHLLSVIVELSVYDSTSYFSCQNF